VLKLPVVGWILETPSCSSVDVSATSETSIITGASAASLKIATPDFGTGPVSIKLYQLWNAAEYLSAHVAQCRGLYVNVFADVKLSAATASACRLFVTVDGTGGGTSYSAYHGTNTDWERLGLSVQIPADATSIQFGLDMESDATDHYIDNVMVAATAAAQTSLEWQPRNPVVAYSPRLDAAYTLAYTTPPNPDAHITGDGTADTDYDINANRPAWATIVNTMMMVAGTQTNNAFIVSTNGDTQQYPLVNLQVSGVDNYVLGPIVIGQDGQLKYSITNTSDDGYFWVKRWIGENL
jgi:hypothetical protein